MVRLLLFQLLSVVFCIPVTQLYRFGRDALLDATRNVFGLKGGNDVSSDEEYVEEIIQFYGKPEDCVIVSDLVQLPTGIPVAIQYYSQTFINYKIN